MQVLRRACLMPYVVTKSENKMLEVTENLSISTTTDIDITRILMLIANFLCDAVSSQPECGKPCNSTNQVMFFFF